MPRQLTCENCGALITDAGWKAMPAVVVNGELVGTRLVDVTASQHKVVGDPSDLCLACCPIQHPETESADK